MIFMNYILILTHSDNVIFSQSSSDMYLFRKYCHMTLGLRGREYHRNYDHHFVHLFSCLIDTLHILDLIVKL